MRQLIQLKELIDTLDNLSWDLTIYTKGRVLSRLDESVLILDDDAELERDEEDEPLYATENGFRYFLDVSSVQDIRDNLQAQNPNYSVDDLLAAIKYFVNNDAYVCLNS